MGAADFDDVFEIIDLHQQCRMQLFQPRQQHIARGHGDGHMHRSGESIVRRLPHIYMIIRVNRLFAAHHAAQHFNGAV